MRVRFTAIAMMAALAALTTIPNVMAQGKTKKNEKSNIQGTIQNISRDTSTITVRMSNALTRLVVYNPNTKFRYGHSDANKPGTSAQVKEQNFISCAGTFDAKSELVATECVYREAK